jgi:hypothetical protein
MKQSTPNMTQYFFDFLGSIEKQCTIFIEGKEKFLKDAALTKEQEAEISYCIEAATELLMEIREFKDRQKIREE